MTISRRDALKSGAGAAVAFGTSGGMSGLFAQSANLVMKTIPASGEMIVPVGIGTNRYGVGTSEAERAPLRDTMARFVELGGSVMDTAQIYGTSERVIGDLASELGIRDRLFLVTKTDIRGQIVGAQGLQMAFEKLRTDVIDGFLVHNFANTANELAVMRDWQAEGKIRYIGASTSTDNQHADMVNLLNNEKVQLIQINYSLGDRESDERVLPLAADKGVAVMLNVPFGGGPGVLLGFFEGAHARAAAALSAAERRRVAIDDLTAYFGPRAAKPVAYLERDWCAEDWSLGCYGAYATPGTLSRFGPALRAPVGPLHHAGTETATRWTGYLDGAVESGQRAAAEVLAALRQ